MTDHRAEAANLLRDATTGYDTDNERAHYLAAAQIHALLAITDALTQAGRPPALAATAPQPPAADQLAGHRGTCDTCLAPIVWARTLNGKPMPVDPQPHADGNVELQTDLGDGRAPVAVVRSRPGGASVRYRTHFATCPDADKHRRTRRG